MPDQTILPGRPPATLSTRDRRLYLGPAAVLSVAEAVRLAPVRESALRQALREHGRIGDLCGSPVVVWGDVLALVTYPDGGTPLDRLTLPAPANSPGPTAAQAAGFTFKRSGVL